MLVNPRLLWRRFSAHFDGYLILGLVTLIFTALT